MKVLSEYHSAIMGTVEEKGIYFNTIVSIDTSEKTQNEVSREVTDKTLKILRDLLVERIGYIIPSKELHKKLCTKRITDFASISSLIDNVNFEFRSIVEESTKWIQPIPIAVITDSDRTKVLIVKKNEKSAVLDSPERNKLLLYVGGHSRKEDCTINNERDFLSLCRATLGREIKEEIGITVDLEALSPYIIYTPDLDKSRKHFAVCFVIQMDIDELNLRLDPAELRLTRGASKSGKFFSIGELVHHVSELESWGIEILKEFFNVRLDQINTDGQVSLSELLMNTDETIH